MFSNKKVFSLSPNHHELRETEIIVKETKFCFSHLLRNQSAPERNLIMKKGVHCLSIICENHIFQDLINFL